MTSFGWESETVYSSPEDYYSSLLVDISHASQSIELAVYIFALDDLGQRIFDALARAARRGVKVCVQLDGIGSAEDGEKLAAKCASENIDCRIYHPLPWYLYAYRWSVDGVEVVELSDEERASLREATAGVHDQFRSRVPSGVGLLDAILRHR